MHRSTEAANEEIQSTSTAVVVLQAQLGRAPLGTRKNHHANDSTALLVCSLKL